MELVHGAWEYGDLFSFLSILFVFQLMIVRIDFIRVNVRVEALVI